MLFNKKGQKPTVVKGHTPKLRYRERPARASGAMIGSTADARIGAALDGGRVGNSTIIAPTSANGGGFSENLTNDFYSGNSHYLLYAIRRFIRELPHMQGFFQMVKQQAIGDRGIVPTFASIANRHHRELVQREWAKFANNPAVTGDRTLVDVLEGAVQSFISDGMALFFVRYDEAFPSGMGLFPVGREYLAESKENLTDNIARGRKFSATGRVEQYMFYNSAFDLTRRASIYHFNNTVNISSHNTIAVTAVDSDKVLTVQRFLRHDSTDGEITWLLPILRRLLRIDDIDTVTLKNIAVAAMNMGFIKRTAEFNSDGAADFLETEPVLDDNGNQCIDEAGKPIFKYKDTTVEKVEEFIENSIRYLRKGEEFQPFDPDFPSIPIIDFRKEILREVAAALGVDFPTFNSSPSDTNNAALRLFAINTRALMKRVQNLLETGVMRPLVKKWLEFQTLPGGPLAGISKRSLMEAHDTLFSAKVMGWVDPQKESQMNKMLIEMGVLSPVQVAQDLGKDIRETLAGYAAIAELAEEIGEDKIKKGMEFCGILAQPNYLRDKAKTEAIAAGNKPPKPTKPSNKEERAPSIDLFRTSHS